MRRVYLVFLLVTSGAAAQLPQGGMPLDWGEPVDQAQSVPLTVLGPVEHQPAPANGPAGFRFGMQREVDVDLITQGQWSATPGGTRVCRFGIRSAGAVMMSVQFSSFSLPPGGRLFVYDAQRTRYLGGFTEENEQPGGDFATALLPGEAVVVEYQEPAAAAHANVRISGITHAWMSPFPQGNDVQRDIYPGYPSSPCHTNVACPVAEGWQEQNRSVVMFVRPSGEGCNGVLLNNSQQDGTPYLLIANHCYQTNESQWIFYFNYQSPGCVGDTGQTTQTVLGSVKRAGDYYGDFCLMELNDAPPASFGAYYAGWDRSGTAPDAGAGILNPLMDVKKINFFDTLATSESLDGVACWKFNWFSGLLEPVGSGSPIFNKQKRVVGHMVGGMQTCANATTEPGYASKFSVNWNIGNNAASRLRDWLDPSNTLQFLDGYDPNGAPPRVEVRLKALLQGPYDPGSGLMTADLNAAGLVPLTEPYSASGYVHHGPGGGEGTSAAVLAKEGEKRVVDWVVVELRNKNSPAQVVATRSALIRRDGAIVDVDGFSDVRFTGVAADQYYVAVRHRNHLGLATAAPVSLSASASLIDLTTAPLLGGAQAAATVGGAHCLWSGDVTGDGTVRYTGPGNDRDAVLVRLGGGIATSVVQGYWPEDANMDGLVKYAGAGNDRDLMLVNLGGNAVNVLSDQLP